MASTGELEGGRLSFGPGRQLRDPRSAASADRATGCRSLRTADNAAGPTDLLDRPNEVADGVAYRAGRADRREPAAAPRPEKLDRGTGRGPRLRHRHGADFVKWVGGVPQVPDAFAPLPPGNLLSNGGGPADPLPARLLAARSRRGARHPQPKCRNARSGISSSTTTGWNRSITVSCLPAVNKHTAKYNPDGTVTFVIAARDPGMGNYMDTAGHQSGSMLLRWTRARTHPLPRCRVAKLASIAQGTMS